MDIRDQHIESPYFSICVPQHNRTSFLLEALRMLAIQSFRQFEVCIADDCSTDGREHEIIDFLRRERLSFAYKKNERNLRYDGNLRASIALATGRYCILHGNDDCLKSETTLQRLHDIIEQHGRPGVITTNFETWDTGEITRRIPITKLHPGTPEVAATRYRNVAFVTGVTVDRERALPHVTDRWDGSEMYQMLLMARVVALGAPLLEIEESLVRKNIDIPGEIVDSHVRAPKVKPCPIIPRRLPMTQIGRVVADGIRPALDGSGRRALNARILRQLYTYIYPMWVIEYRRIQSWKFALGLSLGQSPRYAAEGVELSLSSALTIRGLHLLTASIALSMPLRMYDAARPRLYSFAKRA